MNRRNNTALLVIDAQNDFMDIPSAALPVAGAVKDTERLAQFIKNHNPGTIFASQDSHYSLDISHPRWWADVKGNDVPPFTLITVDDIKNGKYVPRINPSRSLKYVEDLQANGEFLHFIWPEHCLMGSTGHAFLPVFFDTIKEWMNKNLRWVNFITKGVNPYTEHFGIFRANVPITEDPNTQVNQAIFQTLNSHETIFLAGQARSHCVANSLRQLLQIAPQLAPKIKVLEDCMSDVQGLPTDFYIQMNKIYEDAINQGVEVIKSTDVAGVLV
jgi:nicotinamidase/pyrazinamidase